ncbi:MAG TPA: hypothetical protein VIM51_08760, partial [Desulfosporosinus sp.]
VWGDGTFHVHRPRESLGGEGTVLGLHYIMQARTVPSCTFGVGCLNGSLLGCLRKDVTLV